MLFILQSPVNIYIKKSPKNIQAMYTFLMNPFFAVRRNYLSTQIIKYF